jgi:cation transport ATPase
MFTATSTETEAQGSGTDTAKQLVYPAADQLPACALAARLHSYSHASIQDLRRLLNSAHMLTPERERASRQISSNCELCVYVGRPTPSRKVSPIRIVAEFNQSVQVDYMFITLLNIPLTLFHIVDSSTA